MRWVGIAGVGLLCGCGVAFDRAPVDEQGAGAGGTSPANGGSDTAASTGQGGGEGKLTCPDGLPGPALVAVPGPEGSICIDATEVTIAQYKTFEATSPAVDPQDPLCGWKTDFLAAGAGVGDCTAEQHDTAERGDHPISCVDWCDARAYCQWAGKRLCGGISGRSLTFADHADPNESEWAFVCTRGGAQAYPYGDAYDGSQCVGDDFDGVDNDGAGTTEPVGTGSCEGGFEGVFDMVGNVWEWEDACEEDGAPEDDLCQHGGGSFWDGESSLRCDRDGYYSRSFRNKNFGFRCCADPG